MANGTAFITDTTAVVLKLKQIIKANLLDGKVQSDTYKTLHSIIAKFCRRINDEKLRREFEVLLAQNCVKWYTHTKAEIATLAQSVGGLAVLVAMVNTPPSSKQAIESNGASEPTKHYIQPGKQQIVDVRKKVKKQLSAIIDQLATSSAKDMTGSQLRSKAEMYVRHEAQRSSIEQMRSQGVKLVWASTHADCSERCSHWQGKLYSLDGTSGSFDGYSYQPIENALYNAGTPDKGKHGDGMGLFGYNCRHRLTTHREGLQPPKAYTKSQMELHRKLNARQTRMELSIRKDKERAHLLRGVDNKQSRRLFERAAEKTKMYREFCADNNRVALPFRTQVTTQEQQATKDSLVK